MFLFGLVPFYAFIRSPSSTSPRPLPGGALPSDPDHVTSVRFFRNPQPVGIVLFPESSATDPLFFRDPWQPTRPFFKILKRQDRAFSRTNNAGRTLPSENRMIMCGFWYQSSPNERSFSKMFTAELFFFRNPRQLTRSFFEILAVGSFFFRNPWQLFRSFFEILSCRVALFPESLATVPIIF